MCVEHYLKKFEHGAPIKPDELAHVEEIASLGFLQISFGRNNDEGGIVNTAKTTPFGLKRLRKHRAMKNPVKRFIYCFIDSLYH